MNITDFYNHAKFMRDVHAGEQIIKNSDRELKNMKKETTTIKQGDEVVSTGKGSVIKGLHGKVLDIFYTGKFLKFKVRWKNSCITNERTQDIEPYKA